MRRPPTGRFLGGFPLQAGAPGLPTDTLLRCNLPLEKTWRKN